MEGAAKRVFWRTVLPLVVVASVSTSARTEPDEETVRYAREVCYAQAALSGADYGECVQPTLDAWKRKPDKQRAAAIKRQAADIVKACRSESEGAGIRRCALDQAAKLGAAYVHPAGPLAVWDREGEVLAEETAHLKPIQEKCRRSGYVYGVPRIGMTSRQAEECGWGVPTVRRKTTTAEGVTEVWAYGLSRSITLRAGKVVQVVETD